MVVHLYIIKENVLIKFNGLWNYLVICILVFFRFLVFVVF